MGCGVSMPLEDGHDECVECLGPQHALLARESPHSCMNCFILSARTREARCRYFSVKRAGSPLSEAPKRKVGKSRAEATQGRGECSRPWQGTLPPPMPTAVGWPCVDPLSLPPLGLEEEEGEVDVETVFSDDDDLSCGQREVGAGEGSFLAPHFDEVIGRAARALGVAPPDDLMAPTSRFEEDMEVRPAPVRVPLLPDFEDLVCRQFTSPAATHKWSASCRRFSNMTDRERVACGPLPQVDPALSPLISPSNSILGNATCPSKNCRVMDGLLAKLHKAMATQTRLANSGAIMSLYLRDLSKEVQEGPGGSNIAGELRTASLFLSSIMKEQAVATGRALASFWVARRHLWLSQSQLQQGDRDCLVQLPVEPSAMFGPNAAQLLQQARDNRRCAQEVSGLSRRSRGFRRARTAVPPPAPEAPTWGPGDLRPQLEALRRRDSRQRGKRGRPAQGPSKRPPPS